MKIRVGLFGTLSRKVPVSQSSRSVEVELPAGSTVKDLLATLNISESEGAVVTTEGRIKKQDEILSEGARIQVFQTVHGG